MSWLCCHIDKKNNCISKMPGRAWGWELGKWFNCTNTHELWWISFTPKEQHIPGLLAQRSMRELRHRHWRVMWTYLTYIWLNMWCLNRGLNSVNNLYCHIEVLSHNSLRAWFHMFLFTVPTLGHLIVFLLFIPFCEPEHLFFKLLTQETL